MQTYIFGARVINRTKIAIRINTMKARESMLALASLAMSLSRQRGIVTNTVAIATT